jgi:hypothetical protein
MYNESASLVLRTSDLPSNSSNNIGSSDQYYTNMTWSNINLRTLLGNIYDKYDKFALVPVAYLSNVGDGTFGTTNDDRIVTINISGLPFTNNVYNSSSKTNQVSSTFYVARFVQNTYITGSTGGSVLTFTKNQELVNLNIFYQRVNLNGNGNYNVATTTAFPQMVFTFNIYGITKSDRVGDLNSSRIFEK